MTGYIHEARLQDGTLNVRILVTQTEAGWEFEILDQHPVDPEAANASLVALASTWERSMRAVEDLFRRRRSEE